MITGQNGDYRIVALDMDGTLLNTRHETTEYTRKVIERAASAGKIVALSTGRCLSELWAHFEQLPGIRYAICENGACVYDICNRVVIDQIALSPDQVQAVFDVVRSFDVKKQFFRNNQSCMAWDGAEGLRKYHIYGFKTVFETTALLKADLEAFYKSAQGSIEKFNLYCTCQEDKVKIRSAIENTIAGLMLSDSIGVGLEVSPAGATKARGLEILCRHLNVPMESTMAVGDGSNDLSIIQSAGLSVAMGNAIDAVKALAQVQTEDCDHDGAARAIQRYMLGETI